MRKDFGMKEKDTKKTEGTPVDNGKAVPETPEAEPKTEENAKDPLEVMEAALAESKDKYLRMLAEYDNYRRRSQKERETVYRDAVCDTVKQMLPIADNINRAVLAEGDLESVRQGLDMTGKALETLFAQLGVEAYGKPGDVFDPNLHNAVMHEDNPDMGEGLVSDVFQCGYRMGDKVIRFAMVKVVN